MSKIDEWKSLHERRTRLRELIEKGQEDIQTGQDAAEAVQPSWIIDYAAKLSMLGRSTDGKMERPPWPTELELRSGHLAELSFGSRIGQVMETKELAVPSIQSHQKTATLYAPNLDFLADLDLS